MDSWLPIRFSIMMVNSSSNHLKLSQFNLIDRQSVAFSMRDSIFFAVHIAAALTVSYGRTDPSPPASSSGRPCSAGSRLRFTSAVSPDRAARAAGPNHLLVDFVSTQSVRQSIAFHLAGIFRKFRDT
jgi:hypothetical protein